MILSAGCAALSPITATKESLEERAKNYMQAQIDRKWDRAYTFFDSASREGETRESYLSRSRKLSNKGFKIEEIKVLPSGDQATVKVSIDISYMGYNFPGVSQTQNWVYERGEWFVKSGLKSQKNPFNMQEKQ
jgi:hypothetical protein